MIMIGIRVIVREKTINQSLWQKSSIIGWSMIELFDIQIMKQLIDCKNQLSHSEVIIAYQFRNFRYKIRTKSKLNLLNCEM